MMTFAYYWGIMRTKTEKLELDSRNTPYLFKNKKKAIAMIRDLAIIDRIERELVPLDIIGPDYYERSGKA